MSYLPTIGNAVTGSWFGASVYAPAHGSAITGSWAIPVEWVETHYRLMVSDSEPVELPLASVQCTRRLGASTWMVATIPQWSAELETQCVGLIGETMRVEIGHNDQWDDFLDSTVTEIASETSPHSGQIKLTGRVANPAYITSPKSLTGISSKTISNGRRKVRCEVDNLLRPNDTANDGTAQWTVGIIAYQIDAATAWMDVTEDA